MAERPRRGKGKQAITQAALSLFVEKGSRATTREIASLAGTAEGTIYRHFKGKEDLALTLFIQKMDLFARHLKQGAGAGRPRTRLKGAIRAFTRFARDEPLVYSYIIWAHPTELPKVPEERLKPKDIFVDIIRQGMKAGEFRRMDENLAAAMVIGMVIRVILFIETKQIALSHERAAALLYEAAMKLLLPP